VRAQIERECERLALVKRQIAALERQRREQQADEQRRNPVVALLMRLRSIGLTGAWMLTYELFGWREFANGRQVGGCVGLTPTPYASGKLNREQGISKTGNKRVRSLMVELAWLWLRLQPDSELTRWFHARFAPGGKRMRRIGIVALARRLVVALWRYVTLGQIPAGAALKPLAEAA
jgi:transposase